MSNKCLPMLVVVLVLLQDCCYIIAQQSAAAAATQISSQADNQSQDELDVVISTDTSSRQGGYDECGSTTTTTNKFKCRCKFSVSSLIVDCSQLNLERVPVDLQQNVNYLNFTSNMLIDVQKSYFERYTQLKTLKIKRNNIKKLGDGAFYDLQSLESLSLDGNRLTEITGKWLYGMTNLQRLSINHNRIENINVSSFWSFIPNISYMSLGHNKLKRITTGYFYNLKSLLELRLHHNYMNFIEPDSFVHMEHLKILDLSSNKLEVVLQSTSGIFNGLTELEQLDLQNNEIDTIREDCFKPLVNLRYLDMRKNPIRTLQPTTFANQARLYQFYMDSQRLTCDCDIGWLVSATESSTEGSTKDLIEQSTTTTNNNYHNFVGHEEATCAYPESLRMLKLRDLVDGAYRWRVKRPNCNNSGKPILLDERPVNNTIFFKGQSGSLSCRASVPKGEPTVERILITWQKYVPGFGFRFVNQTYADTKGRLQDPNDETREIVGTTLELINITETDSGEYQCVVSNRYGNVYSKTINMNTYLYPYFVSKSRDTIRARVNGSVDIVCATHGIPSPKLVWSFVDKNNNLQTIPAAIGRRLIYNGETTLSLTKLSHDDEGTYSCRSFNVIGSIYANFTLSITNGASISSSSSSSGSKQHHKNFRLRSLVQTDTGGGQPPTTSMLSMSSRQVLINLPADVSMCILIVIVVWSLVSLLLCCYYYLYYHSRKAAKLKQQQQHETINDKEQKDLIGFLA